MRLCHKLYRPYLLGVVLLCCWRCGYHWGVYNCCHSGYLVLRKYCDIGEASLLPSLLLTLLKRALDAAVLLPQ